MEALLIKNVQLLTMDEEHRRFSGWLLAEAGKIKSLGTGAPPENLGGVQVVDGAGGFLLPGLVDCHSHIGLYEDSLGFEGADGNEDTDPVTPQLRALDGINPMDRAFSEAVEAGVTTVVVSPGSANPIGGQIAAMKTWGRRVDDMLLRQPVAMKFAFGENPKQVYHDKDQTPVTRMATAALIREQLHKAKEYQSRREKAAADPDETPPDYDAKLEALEPLLGGLIEAHFHAHRADDIFTALRIAREFSLKPVIVHGTEAHLVADILAKEHVPIIAGPFMTDRSKPELKCLTEKSPMLLCRAGIETAITVDHPEYPERLLLQAAMMAHKAGMAEEDALCAVTCVPAKIAGLGGRVGALRQGLDADFVLYDGHPLEYKSNVTAVFIDGVCRFRREK